MGQDLAIISDARGSRGSRLQLWALEAQMVWYGI